jgi:hypothetical protein
MHWNCHRLPQLLALSGALLLTASCGTANQAGTAQPTPSSTSKGLNGGKETIARYLDCLRSHGVPMPSGAPSARPPSPGAPKPTGPQFPGGAPVKPSGVADSTWTQAKAACTGIVPGL